MCGISAVVTFKPIEVKSLIDMNDLIIHRGPDGGGFVLFNNEVVSICGTENSDYAYNSSYTPQCNINRVNASTKFEFALAHRRLAIVDLSASGHQPMLKHDNWITYNGEVYNYIEIREELIGLGHVFTSESDTEVILAAYKEWGIVCLHKFNGMFAFVLYDKIKHCFFVARDRFGVKPLYYYQNEYGLFFASELKQFTVLPGWEAKLNHQRTHDFLVHGLTDHTNETLFAGVKQLRGGEYSIVDLYRPFEVKHTKWYRLSKHEQLLSYDNASKKFEKIFRDSIKLRLRSDVEVGSCLSGGLDSSAIVCVMAEELSRQGKTTELLKTISACSKHKAFDESEYVDEVNLVTHAKSFKCYPELEQLFNQLDQITWHQDEPFGSTSIYAQWSVFALAKDKKLKVMLDGQGADEQLAGYQGLYFQVLLNQLLNSGKVIQYIRELYYLHKHHGFNVKNGLFKSIMNLFPVKVKLVIGKVLGKNKYKTSWLNNSILKCINLDPFKQTGMDSSNIQNTLHAQLISNNVSMLLHWEDRDSMAHSIESRVPFLDYRLVEFLMSMPYDYKIKNGITKLIMRNGLKDILPHKINNRMSKLGFVTPEEIWVKENPELFRCKLIEAVDQSLGVLNKSIVLTMFDEIIAGQRSFDFWMWRLISFGNWMQVFKVKVN